mgnify:CR=1 FL=1
MNAYNDASLIAYPSGYKESKIYAQKPIDGTGDLTFARASSATRVNEQGLIEVVATNVPRIDFTGGGCGKLLLEGQRTNYSLYSDDLTQFIQSGTITLTSGQADYNGNTNAYKVNNGTTSSYIYLNDGGISVGVVATYSAYIKNVDASTSQIYSRFSNTAFIINLNWTGTVLTSLTAVSSETLISYDFEELSGGFYRVWATYTTRDATQKFRIYPSVGSSNENIIYGGHQVEEGSYETSLINTSGTTVTRVADSSSTTGLSSVIGQTEGVLYAKIASFTNTSPISSVINISDGSSSNQIAIWYGTNLNEFKILIRQSGNKLFHTTTLTDATQFIKVAVLYKSGGSKVYINGSLITSSTSTFTFTNPLSVVDFGGIGLGNVDFNGKLQELQLFPSALDDATLATLTTL